MTKKRRTIEVIGVIMMIVGACGMVWGLIQNVLAYKQASNAIDENNRVLDGIHRTANSYGYKEEA